VLTLGTGAGTSIFNDRMMMRVGAAKLKRYGNAFVAILSAAV